MQGQWGQTTAFDRAAGASAGVLRARPLLEADRDLGALLTRDRAEIARREIHVAVREVSCGSWTPARLLAPAPLSFGILLVSGFAVRTIIVGGEPSAELFGPGDVIRTWEDEPELNTAEWQVLEPISVVLLDGSATATLFRFPEVVLMLFERVATRARRLATTQAISQLTGVERRLEALLWHLADLWGKVRVDGVAVPLSLSHRQLAALIGARLPTVSTAAALLADQGRVSRCHGGGWLLHGDPPAYASVSDEPEPGVRGANMVLRGRLWEATV